MTCLWGKSIVRGMGVVVGIELDFAYLHVLAGDLAGALVSMWGNYTFTQGKLTIAIPFQSTAKVADGKIVSARIYFDNLSVVEELDLKVTQTDAVFAKLALMAVSY